MSNKNKKLSSDEYLRHLLVKRMALRGLRYDSILRKDELAINAINDAFDKNEALIAKVSTYLVLEDVING